MGVGQLGEAVKNFDFLVISLPETHETKNLVNRDIIQNLN